MKKQLSEWRDTLMYSKRHIAKLLGVSHSTVNRWENGECNPETTNLMKLCELFGCSCSDIFLPRPFTKSESKR